MIEPFTTVPYVLLYVLVTVRDYITLFTIYSCMSSLLVRHTRPCACGVWHRPTCDKSRSDNGQDYELLSPLIALYNAPPDRIVCLSAA